MSIDYPNLAKRLLLGFEEVKKFYVNGQLMNHYWHRKGLIEGASISYHLNGVVASKFWYKNGLMEGECKIWHDNGRLNIHSSFQKDNITGGEYKEWDQTGKLKSHCWYKDGYITNFPKEIKLKKGYIFGGDGNYYAD